METALQMQPIRGDFIPPTSLSLEDQTYLPVYIDETKPFKPFIEANTKAVTMQHLKDECIIPVFSKDNEITISHATFIETIHEAAMQFFRGEQIEDPDIRVSHIVKGRIPEAIHKPINQLLDTDKTIYYERMMFCIEIPTIHQSIDGNPLNLTIGGVRAYNQENLYSKKTMEKFKIFIGFKNIVCCNMCISTDGYKNELKVLDAQGLWKGAFELFRFYNPEQHIKLMESLLNTAMTEHLFAQFLGKSRLYQCLPQDEKKRLPLLLMTDTQINLIAKAYYHNDDFKRDDLTKEISMWRVYNLLTGANKTSYIDNFLDRSHNAFQFAEGINSALYKGNEYSWFIE